MGNFTRLAVAVWLVILLVPTMVAAGAERAAISGELKQWHKVTLTVEGPYAAEDGSPNPFLDYRMQVTFSHKRTGLTYIVPGYFAADGDAANTSATSGNKWRAHLAPDSEGEWSYVVSFRKGKHVAISDQENAGEAVTLVDGLAGSFVIGNSDKIGRDMRAKGRLKYVGKHHLQFAGTGEYFLKAGADAPENFLAYREFDGDFKADGHKDNLVKDWGPHVRDWRSGDPTWQNDKGKGIIGAINYLASQGLNSFSFIPLNIEGDDRNVFPYTSYDVRDRIDCSRMDQWEIVFSHGTNMGMYLHFKTQEAENVNLLDNGHVGPQRKLYYRELIARFAHHLALNWNLGEEVGLGHEVSTVKKVAWGEYFRKHDPYNHHMVIHNGNNHFDLLGDNSALTGFSLQTSQPDFSNVHYRTRQYIRRSTQAGKPWVVACDEPGDAMHSLVTDEEDPTHDNARMNALWGNIMAGGAGVEWYFGYKHPHSDLTCQDYRVRQNMWKQSRIALDFFTDHKIPFWDMANANKLVDTRDAYCFAQYGKLYLVYLKRSQSTSLDLSDAEGVFEVVWFNPREGGELRAGSTQAVRAGSKVMLGNPPGEGGSDWLAVVRPGTPARDYPPGVSAGDDTEVMLPKSGESVTVSLKGSVSDVSKANSEIKANWSMVGGPERVDFKDAGMPQTEVTLRSAGEYLLRLTASDDDMDSQATVKVVVEPFQEKMTRTLHAFDDVYLEGFESKSNHYLKVEGNRRVAFLKFRLQNLPAKILDAHLRLKVAGDTGSGTLRAFIGSHSDWTVETLNKSKAPWPRKQIASKKVSPSVGDIVTIPVLAMFPGEEDCTLILKLDAGGNDIWFGSSRSENAPELVITYRDTGGIETNFGVQRGDSDLEATKPVTSKNGSPPFEFTYDVARAAKVHKQSGGIVVVEAEDYDSVDRQDHRYWRLTSTNHTPEDKPDPDPSHAKGASGGAYLEILPDTRVTHADPLVGGVSFCNVPGQCSVLYYPVVFEEPGRYYVWVRMCCTGSEDNGLHVGIDGKWPQSGARLQFTGKHGQWQWDSRQRTKQVHTGVLGKIWLDVEEPGLHTIMFSMREDGFEFDKFLLTQDPMPMPSKSSELGPPASSTR